MEYHYDKIDDREYSEYRERFDFCTTIMIVIYFAFLLITGRLKWN